MMKTRNEMTLAAVIALATMAVSLTNGFAAGVTWTGATSSAWDEDGNWSGGVPTTALEAVVDSSTVSSFLTIADGDDAQCERLTVRISGQAYMTGGSLTMNGGSGRWRVGWRNGDVSTMEVSGGTINTNYTLQICEDLGATGTLLFANATATIGRGIDVGTNTGGVATFTMNSGTFTASNNGNYPSQVGTAGTLNVNDGTLDLQAALTVRDGGVVKLGGGTVKASGLTIQGAGYVDLTGGRLLLLGDLTGGSPIAGLRGNGVEGDYETAFDGTYTVFTAPPSANLNLTIAQNGSDLDFTWNSTAGKLYDLLSDTVLTGDPATWSPYDDGVNPVWENIPASGTGTNTLDGVPRSGSPRFFVVLEKAPPPLLDENFDGVTAPNLPAGWTTTGAGTTAWQLGGPTTTGPAAASSAPNCVGTNISADYTGSADVSLISPAIAAPAAGATLSFRQFIDTDDPPGTDAGSVRILDADNSDALIEEIAGPITGIQDGWTSETVALPAAALGKNIKIEFRFTSDDNGQVFAGFYIDDVVLETP